MTVGVRELTCSLLAAMVIAPSSWVLVVVGSASSHRVGWTSGGSGVVLHHHEGRHEHHGEPAKYDHGHESGPLEPDHLVPVFASPSLARSFDIANAIGSQILAVVASYAVISPAVVLPSLESTARPGPAPPQPAASVTILRI